MATGGVLDSLEQLIECDICMEIMKKPQALNCLHHFCYQCTVKIDRVIENGCEGISCPMCRKFTPGNVIQDSFIMNNLLDIYHKRHSGGVKTSDVLKECKQCGNKEVNHYCSDCKMELCGNCKERHLLIPSCSLHTIVPNNDIEQVITITNYCNKHPHCVIKYNCVTCNQAVCAECKVEYHDTHNTESIEVAFKKIAAKTAGYIDVIDQNTATVTQWIDKLYKIKEQYKTNAAKSKANIIREKDKMVKRLENESTSVIEEIDDITLSKIKELDLYIQDWEHRLASQKSLIHWGNTITSMVQGPGPLCELQGGVFDRIKASADEKEMLLNQSINVVHLQFKSQHIWQEKNVFGRLCKKSSSVSTKEMTSANAISEDDKRTEFTPITSGHATEKKSDVSKWKYAELSKAINSSHDVALLEACREEFHKRLVIYHDWRKKNKDRNVPNVYGKTDNTTPAMFQPISRDQVNTLKVQRYFRCSFVRPNDPKKGWWYAHFDGSNMARQIELQPNDNLVLLLAGVDDIMMCELPLEETGLTRKKGAEITEQEFKEVWSKNGGDEYLKQNKNLISSTYLKDHLGVK